MLYLLDTDTTSYAIRGASATLDAALAAAVPGSLAISAITRAELMFGLEKRGNPRALVRLVQGFMARVAVVHDDTTITLAARFDSGIDLLALLDLQGGMPTRVSVPAARLDDVMRRLQAVPAS